MTTINNLTAIFRKALLVILFATSISTISYSQPANAQEEVELDEYGIEMLPDDPDPQNVPLDGGVTLILAAAGAAGAKKLKDAKAKKKQAEENNI